MRTNFNIVLILSFLLGGCVKSLTPVIYDQLSSSNFPATEADGKVLVNGIYGEFRGDNAWYRYSIDPQSRLMLGEFGTEECWIAWDWANLPQINFDYNPSYTLWGDFYQRMVPAVTKATAAIYQLSKISFSDPVNQKRLIAEVRCCRDLWLYDLEGFFGPPPVVLDATAALNPETLYFPPRLSDTAFLSFVDGDLRSAIADLPVDPTDYGRFTKGAAMHILLKFYMRHKQWQKAADISQQIIGLGKYSLMPTYSDIWDVNHKKNAESIFVLGCVAQANPNSNILRAHVLPPDYVSADGGNVVSFNGYRVPWNVWDSFDPTDQRRAVLVKDYYINNNGSPTLVDGRATGRLPNGALPLKYGEDRSSDGLYNGNDIVILRYADVLLLRAEALNMLQGPNQESIDLINQVRDRAFNNNPAQRAKLADFNSTQDLNDYLLRERLFEFCFEGERREDLIRQGKYIEFAKARGINASSYEVRYPIPSWAIIEGQGHFSQNDGY